VRVSVCFWHGKNDDYGKNHKLINCSNFLPWFSNNTRSSWLIEGKTKKSIFPEKSEKTESFYYLSLIDWSWLPRDKEKKIFTFREKKNFEEKNFFWIKKSLRTKNVSCLLHLYSDSSEEGWEELSEAR